MRKPSCHAPHSSCAQGPRVSWAPPPPPLPRVAVTAMTAAAWHRAICTLLVQELELRCTQGLLHAAPARWPGFPTGCRHARVLRPAGRPDAQSR